VIGHGVDGGGLSTVSMQEVFTKEKARIKEKGRLNIKPSF